jgi:hypothetical protein
MDVPGMSDEAHLSEGLLVWLINDAGIVGGSVGYA